MQPDSGPDVATNNDVSLVHLSKTFGTAPALSDLTLNVERGSFFSLLGPSGCGKTTTLRLIAGFEQPTEGQILIRGQDVAGLPPYRRDVNTVFQSYALFPHMSVADNIAYGLRQRGIARSDIRCRVDEALAMVRLPGAGARRPAQLSGGQQQRVALARALVNRPTVLLLDEPLSALDLKLRKEMQIELKALQQQVGITFIYVTHDQEEAITLSDRIAVMNRGRLEQVGTPTEIYERPQTRFVADFIGLTNFITGRVRQISGGGSSCVLGVTTEIGDLICSGPQPSVSIGDTVTITLRPEKVLLAEPQTAAPPGWNATQGTITQAIFLGPQNEYRIQVAGAPGAVRTAITVRQQNVGDITSAMPAESGSRESLDDWRVFGPGERVTLLWRHDVSLVLRDAGSSAQTEQGVGAQAPASHVSLV